MEAGLAVAPAATMEQVQRDADLVAEEIREADSIANTAGSYIRIVPMKEPPSQIIPTCKSSSDR